MGAPPPPNQIGRFYRESPLDPEGGVADAWLALDGRFVVKLVRETDSVVVSGFRSDVERIAATGTEPIVEWGVQGEWIYWATERHDSPPLDSVPSKDRGTRIRWVRDAAAALARAHALGIVHQDVRPSTLRVDAGGCVHVSDFVQGRWVEHAALRAPDGTPGSPYYMSPELTRGDPVDERTDVWSLGITLYRMLTEHGPFRGDTRQTLMAEIRDREPATPRSLDSTIDRRLEDTIMRALEKSPSRRIQSAERLADALSRSL